jgi:hypothetical protein
MMRRTPLDGLWILIMWQVSKMQHERPKATANSYHSKWNPSNTSPALMSFRSFGTMIGKEIIPQKELSPTVAPVFGELVLGCLGLVRSYSILGVSMKWSKEAGGSTTTKTQSCTLSQGTCSSCSWIQVQVQVQHTSLRSVLSHRKFTVLFYYSAQAAKM